MPAIRTARMVLDYQWMEGEGRLVTGEGVYYQGFLRSRVLTSGRRKMLKQD